MSQWTLVDRVRGVLFLIITLISTVCVHIEYERGDGAGSSHPVL
jgi:hypothetical protein